MPASAARGGTGSRYVSRAAALAWVGFGPAAPAGGAARWERLRCPMFWERPCTGHGEPRLLGVLDLGPFPGGSEPPGSVPAAPGCRGEGRGAMAPHAHQGLGHARTPGSGWRVPHGSRRARLRVPAAGPWPLRPPTLASCPRCRRTSGAGTQRWARTGRSPAGGCAAAATSRPWATRTAPTRRPAPKCCPGRPRGETATAAPPAPTRPGPSKGCRLPALSRPRGRQRRCGLGLPGSCSCPWRAPGGTWLRWALGGDGTCCCSYEQRLGRRGTYKRRRL